MCLKRIDPSMVFPYLIADRPKSMMVPPKGLSLNTPPNSSSIGSDSEEEEGDEEEQEEEEEEELDVVTLKKRQSGKRCNSISSETRHLTPFALNRWHVFHHHNYAAHPPMRWELLAVKRLKLEISGSPRGVLKQISSNHKCANPWTTDTEDYDNRRTRNMREGTRRNKLKSSLLALRDVMPEVANNEKATQVVILKKVREYIHSMQSDEQRLLSLKEQPDF
ncbi:transcriptional regulator Myc-like [Lampris incognitus]|uniref:transcriptional regulator Myc-like n=1 Tax=Lampris incognitus TaxID=2546036 RepID=UPI0024B5109E|nr:transcriptional regulator Myc-like [Lampris incognitus]